MFFVKHPTPRRNKFISPAAVREEMLRYRPLFLEVELWLDFVAGEFIFMAHPLGMKLTPMFALPMSAVVSTNKATIKKRAIECWSKAQVELENLKAHPKRKTKKAIKPQANA